MGDSVEDSLEGASADGLQSKPTITATDSLMIPSFATNSSAAPPVSVSQGNNSSSWNWSDLGKTLVAGITQGLTRPSIPTYKPPAASTSSGISNGALVAGGVGLALLAVVLLRRREA